MLGARLDLLRWQFDLTWSLLEYHLDRLDEEDLRWEPAALCWTVRPGPAGRPVPDWADAEPDPIPAPSGAWVSWHITWWWGVVADHLRGRPPRERTAVTPAGDAAGTVAALRALRADWVDAVGALTEADLDAPAPFPWPAEQGLTVAHMLGWVNAELMKNTAELGQLRLVRRAGRA